MSALQQALAPFLQAEYSCSAAHINAMQSSMPLIDCNRPSVVLLIVKRLKPTSRLRPHRNLQSLYAV